MGYFDDKNHVQEYIKMADGFDGKQFVEKLAMYLSKDATVLELGMGPGKDLELLSLKYAATGSDSSAIFLNRYREIHPHADLIELDAAALATNRTFQCIYSNKVLHHLTKNDLRRSFINQLKLLEPRGIALHTFWHGDKEEIYEGLRFIYYTMDDLKNMVPDEFKIIEASLYSEMENDDSICLIIKKG